MELNIHKLSPEVRETLDRCVSYGWRPAVAAKILNCKFGFSLTSKDVTQILTTLKEENAPHGSDSESATTK